MSGLTTLIVLLKSVGGMQLISSSGCESASQGELELFIGVYQKPPGLTLTRPLQHYESGSNQKAEGNCIERSCWPAGRKRQRGGQYLEKT